MTKPLRTLEERLEMMEKGETVTGVANYVCGCGHYLFILMENGDVVCDSCRYAQLRLLISELAPIDKGELS